MQLGQSLCFFGFADSAASVGDVAPCRRKRKRRMRRDRTAKPNFEAILIGCKINYAAQKKVSKHGFLSSAQNESPYPK